VVILPAVTRDYPAAASAQSYGRRRAGLRLRRRLPPLSAAVGSGYRR
jgi:hypothetical protein